nr:CopG family transcriptional regulator [Candidatus Sigynarchaeota archaeon]
MTGPSDVFKDVKIPATLYNRIEKRLPKTEFKSVSEYITFLIRETLESIEKEENSKKKDFTPEEEKEIEKRLRNLGYID